MTSFAEDMQVDMRSTEKLLEQLTAAAPSSDCFSDALLAEIPEKYYQKEWRTELQPDKQRYGDFGSAKAPHSKYPSQGYGGRKSSFVDASYDMFGSVKRGRQDSDDSRPSCDVCGLVAAEIQCHQCNQVTCGFCDFQVHKVIPAVHATRVSLRPPSSKPSMSSARRAAEAKNVAESARLLHEGASLDETILEFFKTEEFAEVVHRTERQQEGNKAPQNGSGKGSHLGRADSIGQLLGRAESIGYGSGKGQHLGRADSIGQLLGRAESIGQLLSRAESIGGLLGRADSIGMINDDSLALMDLPLMDPWPTVKTGPAAKKQRRSGGDGVPPRSRGPSAKALSEATRLASRSAGAMAGPRGGVRGGGGGAHDSMSDLMERRPRPAHYEFKLCSDPVQAAAWTRARKVAHARFKAKRLAQRLNPKVRYKSRQKIADNRPRVKGRFVKTVSLVTAKVGA
jgi:hypothetical protein